MSSIYKTKKLCLFCNNSVSTDIDTKLYCMLEEETVDEDEYYEECFEPKPINISSFDDITLDEVIIDGAISFNDKNITHSEFLDIFIEWIEENGWSFGGVTGPYVEEK